MEAAERLSKQDLTVTVPVSEDITGAVSDALNLMTRSTAETIWRIMQISQRLEQATITVKGQNDKVTSVAANEKLVVSDTLNTLEASSTTMSTMASLANECHALADHATTSTQNALEAVQQAVSSMLDIRGTVHESEKSIKRLGERSKEIGSIVEIIKDIAERTHTLALNAGMQAVAAGEAGRGFSVVADEVQRLAEMARESTGQITTLVKSIQSESSESMDIMNKAIGQVVEGSQRADNASNAMQSTGEAATNLAQAVNRLVEQSQKQETFNQGLSGLANQLRISSDATEEELTAQAEEMKKMLSYMKYLVQSVNVFKLPAQKKSA
jgi:methyl-accepting chemotaxis protein